MEFYILDVYCIYEMKILRGKVFAKLVTTAATQSCDGNMGKQETLKRLKMDSFSHDEELALSMPSQKKNRRY